MNPVGTATHNRKSDSVNAQPDCAGAEPSALPAGRCNGRRLLRLIAAHMGWAAATLLAWCGVFRWAIVIASAILWVPVLTQAIRGQWRTGMGLIIGCTIPAVAAPYLWHFVGYPYGYLAYAAACALVGLQVAITAELYATLAHRRVLLLTLGPASATVLEHGRAYFFAWPTLLTATPSVGVPAGQLASIVGPLGLTWISYALQTILALALTDRRRRWTLLALWCAAHGVLNLAGAALRPEPGQKSFPLPTGVLLVQPGIRTNTESSNAVPRISAAEAAARITAAALERYESPLVVWPETTLGTAYVQSRPDGGLELLDTGGLFSVEPYGRMLARRENTYFIAGLFLNYRDARLTNGAVCIAPDGSLQWYEKRTLVWFLETMPADFLWIVHRLRIDTGGFRWLTPGSWRPPFRCDLDGRTVVLQPAICLEKYVYWGWPDPDESTINAFVHIGNESYFAAHSYLLIEHRWAMRLRAIESRRWQFSAQTYRGSCVVDPSGRILAQLPPGPGWLFVSQSGVETRHFSLAELEALPEPDVHDEGVNRERNRTR